MTEKEMYEAHNRYITELRQEMNSNLASFLLTLPIGMSYELWEYLHKFKGDWIE